MSALFNFQSLLLVILLLICTCAYVHDIFPSMLDRKKDGVLGVFWKAARVGERLSPYISICCVGMAAWATIRRLLGNKGFDENGREGASTAGDQGDQEDHDIQSGKHPLVPNPEACPTGTSWIVGCQQHDKPSG